MHAAGFGCSMHTYMYVLASLCTASMCGCMPCALSPSHNAPRMHPCMAVLQAPPLDETIAVDYAQIIAPVINASTSLGGGLAGVLSVEAPLASMVLVDAALPVVTTAAGRTVVAVSRCARHVCGCGCAPGCRHEGRGCFASEGQAAQPCMQ